MAARLAPFAPLAVLLVTGCSTSDVTLQSRPSDLSSARALALLVADTAHCGGFEDYNQAADHWTFTCQTGRNGEHFFTIWTVNGPHARQEALTRMAVFPSPVKGGTYFLVQQGLNYEQTKEAESAPPPPVSDLDRFPGEMVPVSAT